MAEGQPAEDKTTAVDLSAIRTEITSALEARDAKQNEIQTRVLDAFEAMQERERAAIVVPSQGSKKQPKLHEYIEAALKMRFGDPLNQRELQERELDDVLLADQSIPTFFLPEIQGFLAS